MAIIRKDAYYLSSTGINKIHCRIWQDDEKEPKAVFQIAHGVSEYIERYDEKDEKQEWFDKIKALAIELGYAGEVKEYKANPDMYKGHVGDVSGVIRVALTGRVNTPDMYQIMQVLGKDVVIKRLEKAIENLK